MSDCAADDADAKLGLRIGSIFVILATSTAGTLVPIFLRQSRFVPQPLFEFAKFFGSGVIIATAFIHLLAPAFDELNSPCLSSGWTDYSWAPAIAMAAVFAIFFAEVAAYRIGTRRLVRLGLEYSAHAGDAADAHAHSHAHEPPLDVEDDHGHGHGARHSHSHGHSHEHSSEHAHGHAHAAAGSSSSSSLPSLPSLSVAPTDPELKAAAADADADTQTEDSSSTVNQLPSRAEAAAQLIAVAVLEFGVVLHSVIIGLTLATSAEFTVLFIVLVFHQMFEGLGLGSRLAALQLPPAYNKARYVAACLYAVCTPVGIAAGLGVRTSYNGNGATANMVSGVLDATSAGILLYTGLVELLAHEILLNPRMMKSSDAKLAYVFTCICAGAGLMALLGRWA